MKNRKLRSVAMSLGAKRWSLEKELDVSMSYRDDCEDCGNAEAMDGASVAGVVGGVSELC